VRSWVQTPVPQKQKKSLYPWILQHLFWDTTLNPSTSGSHL
jgi:hypothetical protein